MILAVNGHRVEGASLGRLAARAAMFGLLWWILTGGQPNSWLLGLPALMIASLASLVLRAPAGWRWRWSGALRFAGFFLAESLRGGLDVARRALASRMALRPAVLSYRLRLDAGAARVFFVNAASLLPGTLSADLEDDQVLLHVLDASADIQSELSALENRVAGMFGLSSREERRA
jgi:multicomponent Na+:H+ antiporter subunit E